MKYRKYWWQCWRQQKPRYSPLEQHLLDHGIKPLTGQPTRESHGHEKRAGPS